MCLQVPCGRGTPLMVVAGSATRAEVQYGRAWGLMSSSITVWIMLLGRTCSVVPWSIGVLDTVAFGCCELWLQARVHGYVLLTSSLPAAVSNSSTTHPWPVYKLLVNFGASLC